MELKPSQAFKWFGYNTEDRIIWVFTCVNDSLEQFLHFNGYVVLERNVWIQYFLIQPNVL